ncbi:MAG: hypothetical protein JW734_00270 [Candidatus Omnitrophica bacterium]|nr:hypothetical protein [Candidatus Omnitrophota bacterium]
MNKFIPLLLTLIICGCAAKTTRVDQSRNLVEVYDQRENLEGYSSEQILKRFGRPQSREKTFVHKTPLIHWYYKNLYANMKITFVNGIVYEVEYY